MKEIPLTRGMVALVDDDDFERIAKYRWYAHRNSSGIVYARATIKDSNGRNKRIRMHRLVLNECAPLIDHVNGNGLDNRKQNLRLASNSQNLGNSRKGFGQGSSKYRGVHWDRMARFWRACISIKNRTKWLGTFPSEIEAATAYDLAAKEHFGDFARLNFA